MKKLLTTALVAAALATPAMAQQVDMAAMTCGQFMNSSQDDIGAMIVWIDGYLSHKTGITTINLEGIKSDAAKIATHCAANPDAKLLEYVESASN